MGNICILMTPGFQRLKVRRVGDLSENLEETVSIKKDIKTTRKNQSEVTSAISANRVLHPVCRGLPPLPEMGTVQRGPPLPPC